MQGLTPEGGPPRAGTKGRSITRYVPTGASANARTFVSS